MIIEVLSKWLNFNEVEEHYIGIENDDLHLSERVLFHEDSDYCYQKSPYYLYDIEMQGRNVSNLEFIIYSSELI